MRGRPPQISEDALLGAAAEVLLRDGPAATTAAIARQAGVSEGLLFYRYRSKDELVAAVMDRQMRPSPRLSELVADPGDRPVAEALRELAGEILATLRAALPFVEIARASPSSLAILRSVARAGATPQRLIDVATRYFDAEVARGRLRRIASTVAARIVVGTALDRALSEHRPIGGPPPEDDETFLRAAVDLLLHGAAPARAPGSARASRAHRAAKRT